MSQRRIVLYWSLLALCGAVATPPDVGAQLIGGAARHEFELSDAVQLDRADHAAMADLERAQALLAERRWNEAVETLSRVMDAAGNQLAAVAPQRYVGLRQYCQLRLVRLPPEALAVYRRRVDPGAQEQYEQGVRNLDAAVLHTVVDRAIASSWGDRALLALGELSLSAGDAIAARWHWQRILPVEPAQAETWLAYPDSKLDLAAVRARIVLASILEGAANCARDELVQFERLHPHARGLLGGHEADFALALHDLLKESAQWPTTTPSRDWPTFAGGPERNKVQPGAADPLGVMWRLAVKGNTVVRRMRSPSAGTMIADDPQAPLAYYPATYGDLVLACNERQVLAVNSRSGQPAWPGARDAIYETTEAEAADSADPPEGLGAARHTLTVSGGRVLARLGSAATSQPQSPNLLVHPGHLVCLDLAAQGRLLWKIAPEPGWAFEGAPLADAANAYVALRRSDVRPQAHVAAYDLQTGRRRWRRFVCAAETPARSLYHEATAHLLTLAGDTLYFNTSLGAAAALDARDGAIRWLTLYPRARRGDVTRLAPHWHRELTPCLYHQGLLLTAPADNPRIFAFDACGGQLLWQTGSQVEDAIHLLGVVDGQLIAAGRRLYWISLAQGSEGRIRRIWPEGAAQLGFGRGVLAEGGLYWPTRDKVFRLDAATGRPLSEIDLARWGLRGGNLLVASGQLLLATDAELIALGPQPRPRPPAPQQVTLSTIQE